ncbi:MAG: nuclear transport factor 2 family protein [Acidobacteria bacterium]|nr:nuclear transport factor 2 family protein [Acidobacteriota bacterium]
MTREELIAANLAAVEAHFHTEATGEIDKALDLYTDDIVWESPARELVFRGKEATGAMYRRMFESFQVEEFRQLQRFATEERVVDDSVARVVIAGDGVINSPAPVGALVEIRLLHVFEMREGKISRELVFETWRTIEESTGRMPYAATSQYASPIHPAH